MAATDYDWAMSIVFIEEGGYGWDRGDPGGPTKYGITCYDLAEHRGQVMDSMTRWAPLVKAMGKPEAEDIYSTKYRVKDRFNDINPGKDFVILDYGINSGTGVPIKAAQSLLNISVDGVFGPITLSHINQADPIWFINALCDQRLRFMHEIRNGEAWREFGAGWQARVDKVRASSLALFQHNGPPPSTTQSLQIPYLKKSAKAYVGQIS